MKRIFVTFTAIIIGYSSLAQNTKCNCNVVYDDLIKSLEENYIVLAQRSLAGRDVEFENRKAEFKKIVATIPSEDCTKTLQQFLSYFEDGHLFVFELPVYSEKEQEVIRRKIKEDIKNPESILRTLKSRENIAEKMAPGDIIGQWTDGTSNFAIIEEEGYYKAYVMDSKLESVAPGELKAQFTATDNGFEGTYYSYGYSPRYVEGNIYKEGTLLVLTGAVYWGKTGDADTKNLHPINPDDVLLPVIQKIDEENTLFSIPSFMADYQKFNQILLDNLDLLKTTTNLIIDIRGNVGGNAIYFSFLDAYATHAMISSQGLVLASEQTKLYFKKFAENSPMVYGPVVEKIEANMGQIIDGPEYPERKFKPFESAIKNVAIVTDHGCMSAAESFILHSKLASTKVKTFGKPTGGVIDYTSINTLKLNSGEQNIYFGYPTSTLHKEIPKNGYNKTGIIPDVIIKDTVKDKIQFIVDYYKNN